MALITGTLNASVAPTGVAYGLGDGALLFYVPDAYDMDTRIVGAALPFTEIGATLNASIYATGVMVLTGVGTGNNRGLLDKPVTPVLTGVAENEYGRSGSAPDYSNPIIITSTAAGEGGTGTVVTGALDASVTPDLNAGGIFPGDFSLFQAFAPQNLDVLGPTKLFGFVTGVLNKPVTPTLIGVGTGNNRGLLNESVNFLTLSGIAENEYGRTGDFPNYSLPVTPTLDAQGEGGTGTVVTGTLDASVTPSPSIQTLVGPDAVQFYAAYPNLDTGADAVAKEKVLIDGVLDKPINIALTGEGHGPTLGVLDENINYLTLVGAGKGNNLGLLDESVNTLTLSGAGLVYYGILNESVNFLTLTGEGHGPTLGTLDADINLSLTGQANFEHDGTLDQIISLTLNGQALVYHAFLDGSVTPTLDGTGTAITANMGLLDASVTPDLTGVAHGPIEGVLDASINFLTLTGQGSSITLTDGVLDESVNFLTLTGQGHGNNLGVLDQSINNLTLDGVGKAFEIIDGVLDASVTPDLTGVSDLWYGRVNASVTPTLSGAGVSQYGRLDASVNNLTLNGAGVVQFGRLDASVRPTLTGEGLYQASMHGDMTLPVLTIESDIQNSKPADAQIPALTIEAVMVPGIGINVAGVMPAMTIEATGGWDSASILPALSSEAFMSAGTIYNADVIIPALQIDSDATAEVTIEAEVTLPVLISAGVIINSAANNSVATLPSLQLTAVMVPGTVADVDVLLPVPLITGFMAADTDASVIVSLPSFYSTAQMHNGAAAVFNPFTMNTENYGVTEYQNYDFHSVFKQNDKYYGANATGIYELSGSNDDAAIIPASARMGVTDLNTPNLKRVPYAYLGYESDGAMKVDVSIDGEPAIRQYTVGKVSNTTGVKRGRAKIARGLKSKYWQFGVSNVEGSDFEIDTLDFYVQQFNRKAQ